MYMPPARGIIPASSPKQSAPVMVIMPAIPQATSSHPELPISLDISAETMKMPDPIITPTTTIVASNKFNPCLN
jgi:hypothetical protein